MGGPASPREYWDGQAATYDRMMTRLERVLIADSRSRVCSRAVGRTLEVAIGTGRNLGLYPQDVELVGIDLSPGMLAVARKRAAESGVAVDLREADAMRLPFADGEFDSVVCTLGLCAVPDVDRVVAEMHRVLRVDGVLLLFDHVRPTFAPLRWVLAMAEAASRRLQPNSEEHFLRRPLEHLDAHGFVVEQSRRFKAGALEWVVARRLPR